MTKTVRTGGKLYLAGEYSVLTAGQGAILKHIPIYMTGKIHFAEQYRLFSDMFDHAVDLTPDDDTVSFKRRLLSWMSFYKVNLFH